MKMKIIDTDILIDFSHEIPEAEILFEKLQDDVLAISVVTSMEIIRGCRNKKEIISAMEFLDRFRLIHISEAISQNSIELIANYAIRLSIPDALIASTCIVTDSELYTRNTRHFQMISGLRIIRPY